MRHLGTFVIALLLSSSVVAAEPDKFLPDNTTSVVSVNVKQMLESPLGKKYLAPLLQKALNQNAEVAQAFTALGFDPLKDFDSVTFATPGIASTNPQKEAVKATVILHGYFDLAKIQTTAAVLIKQAPDKLSMTREGTVAIYESKNDQQPTYFAFLDQSTAIVSATKGNVVSAIKGGGTGPKLSQAMTTLLSKVDGQQSVWMAALAPAELKKALAGQKQTAEIAEKINAFSAGATFAKDVALNFAVHTADTKTAKDMVKALDALKGFAKTVLTDNSEIIKQLGKDGEKMVLDVIDNIKVGSTQTDATVDVKIGENLIQKVFATVNSLK